MEEIQRINRINILEKIQAFVRATKYSDPCSSKKPCKHVHFLKSQKKHLLKIEFLLQNKESNPNILDPIVISLFEDFFPSFLKIKCINLEYLKLMSLVMDYFLEVYSNNPILVPYHSSHSYYFWKTYPSQAIKNYLVNLLPDAQLILTSEDEFLTFESLVNEIIGKLDHIQELRAEKEDYLSQKIDLCCRPDSPALKELNDHIWYQYSHAKSLSETMNNQNSVIINHLDELLRQALYDIRYQLVAFGSRISLIASLQSDLDISIVLSSSRLNYDNRNNQVDVLRKIRNFLHRRDRVQLFRLQSFISKARVPIIKLIHQSGIEVDICINNQFGCENSFLLRSYNLLDCNVHALMLMVKSWASRHVINQASKGSISSFSWCLLVLYFLMHGLKEPVVPRSRFENNRIIFDELPHIKYSVGELFIRFFQFYALEDASSFNYIDEVIDIQKTSRCFESSDILLDQEEEEDINDVDDNDDEGDQTSEVLKNLKIDDDEIEDLEDRIDESNSKSDILNVIRKLKKTDWRFKIRDPFIPLDLGRVVRCIQIQKLMQTELRLALVTLISNLSERRFHPNAWEILFPPYTDHHKLELCRKCNLCGHIKENCPLSLENKTNNKTPVKSVNQNKAAKTPPPSSDKKPNKSKETPVKSIAVIENNAISQSKQPPLTPSTPANVEKNLKAPQFPQTPQSQFNSKPPKSKEIKNQPYASNASINSASKQSNLQSTVFSFDSPKKDPKSSNSDSSKVSLLSSILINQSESSSQLPKSDSNILQPMPPPGLSVTKISPAIPPSKLDLKSESISNEKGKKILSLLKVSANGL